MSHANNVWATLSTIDVNGKVEKKGNLSYLSWAWAWGELMSHYPESTYAFNDITTFPDSTVEVGCEVVVTDGEFSLARSMWLPVMDSRNNSISNPSSRQISDAKMRCLVKCIAMFGLGHYIYAGEDLPRQKSLSEWVQEFQPSIDAIKESIGLYEQSQDESDLYTGAEEWWTMSAEAKQGLWVATTKGGPFSTKEREVIKSTIFRTVYHGDAK